MVNCKERIDKKTFYFKVKDAGVIESIAEKNTGFSRREILGASVRVNPLIFDNKSKYILGESFFDYNEKYGDILKINYFREEIVLFN